MIYLNKILGEEFVRIFEVDHEPLLWGGVPGPSLRPALDVGHLPHSRHQVGELWVGGKNLTNNWLRTITRTDE